MGFEGLQAASRRNLPLQGLLESDHQRSRLPGLLQMVSSDCKRLTVSYICAWQVLALDKDTLPDHPSSVQVKKASIGGPASPTHKGVPNATTPSPAPKGVSNAVSPGPAPESMPSAASLGPAPKGIPSAAPPGPAPKSTPELPVPVLAPAAQMEPPSHGSFSQLSRGGLSTSNLTLSRHYKGSSASIASDVSLPVAAQELKRRLYQLQK